MIKQILIILGFLSVVQPSSLEAQNWQGIGGLYNAEPRCIYEDTIENVIYVGGEFYLAGNDTVAGIAKWNGNSFSPLGCGVNWDCSSPLTGSYGGHVLAVTKYNGEIYVGGEISRAGGIHVNNIARWNGIQWDSVESGVNGTIFTLTVIDNELYVGGSFDEADGISVNSIAKWNGSEWSEVNAFPNFVGIGNQNFVSAITKYKGELYVGGNFDNDSITDIVKYDGFTWKSVGSGMHGLMSGIECMVVFSNELYVAGAFYKIDGNSDNFIQRWDGTTWHAVGGGTTYTLSDPYSNGQIHDMKVHHNELYIGGVFRYAGGVPANFVAKWDGIKWCGLGGEFDNIIVTLGFCKDTLYIGGGFKTIDGDSIRQIAKFLGGPSVDTCGWLSTVESNTNYKVNTVISPNPFHNAAQLTFSSELINGTITFFNYFGQEVKSMEKITGKEILISRDGLSNGLYFIRVTDGQVVVGQGKIVVE